MKLTAFFPKHSDLNRSQLYDVGDVSRLTIRIPHIVSGKVAGVERVGESNIDYNFDFPKKATFSGQLRISGSAFVGVQSSDIVNQANAELKPRTGYSFAKVVTAKFDLRALCYVLGAATAIGSAGLDFDVPDNPAGYRTLGMGWSVPDLGSLVVGPNVASSANELVTLSALASLAGVTTVTYLRDDIQGTDGLMLVGRGLACYAYRVYANILEAANDTLSYGAHRIAFECGKGSVFSLHSHTDEGGWIRKLMSKCNFPRSVGIVFGMGQNFLEKPLQETVAPEEIMRITISEYLEFVALFPVADYAINGQHSVFERDAGSMQKPLSYDKLPSSVVATFNEVRNLLCDMAELHHDANSNAGIHKAYFEENSVDRHFSQEVIMPWWFVEPSPLVVAMPDSYPVPAKLGAIVELPMFNSSTVQHNSPVIDSLGRAVTGTKVWVNRKPGSFRNEGFSYLLSSAYHPDDGLGQMKVVGETAEGVPVEIPSFLGDTALPLSSCRWVTPHNPMPSPIEGISFGPSCVEYKVCASSRDLSPSEAFAGKVESRLGLFSVVRDTKDASNVTHREVPERIKRKLRVSTYTDRGIEFLNLHTLGSSGPVAGGAPPSSPEPVEEIKKEVPLPAPEAELPPEAPGGSVSLAPAESGVRPTQPTVKAVKPGRKDESVNGD